MDGVGGDVSVETNHGDINVNGGSGFVSLKSVQGEIVLRNAKGRVDISSVNEGVRLSDINGDVSAETTNGGIILERIDSANVDLYAVNGSISYDGPIRDNGAYRLSTHNGTIALAIAEKANVTLSVRTYSGGFRSSFPGEARGSEHAEAFLAHPRQRQRPGRARVVQRIDRASPAGRAAQTRHSRDDAGIRVQLARR